MKQKVGNLRWSMITVISFGLLVFTLDRTNLSVAAGPFMKEYGLNQGQVGIILSAYAWSYALVQIPVGVMLDKIGVKWIMRVGTILWAMATFMTALVSGMGLIILSRVILGFAEGPSLSSGAKAIGYWFTTKERGRAHAIQDAASRFSSVIGVPIVAYAVTVGGWKSGFWFTGGMSLLYAIIYWIWYRDPKQSKLLSASEQKYLIEGGAHTDKESSGNFMQNLGFVLRQKKVWGLTIGFACYTYSYYLFITWLPGYLETEMHMSVLESGFFTTIPWLTATVCDLVFAGWFVDYLINKGYDAVKVRKATMVSTMTIGIAVLGAAFTTNPVIAITFLSLSLGALTISAATAWSVPGLIATTDTVATVGGVMNFFANLMGIAAPIVTGFIASGTGTFSLGFIVAGAFLVIGVLCYLFLLGRIEPIKVENEEPVENAKLLLSK